MSNRRRAWIAAASAVWLATIGGCLKSSDRDDSADDTEQPSGATTTKPDIGATAFVSADTSGGDNVRGVAATGSDDGESADASEEPPTDGSNRSVERGDIYKVLDDGRILNLNRYRGVQVIDISDPTKPTLEGQLAMAGSPVEMYVVGDIAYVLLNNYQSYYGSRDDIQVEAANGGLVAAVDLSDPKKPRLIDQAVIKGDIRESRLTVGDTGSALYVAAAHGYWDEVQDGDGAPSGASDDVADEVAVAGGSLTVIKSFALDGESMTEKDTFELRGDIADIQATTDYMMVARYDYSSNVSRSKVALIDIGSPDGQMVEAGEVVTKGQVQSKFNMDVRGSILRVVSARTWDEELNHLETFDIGDPAAITPVDYCAFGESEDLYATLFVDNSAFFVTYFRTDPFHAFSIDDDGNCEEQSEFVVSGWNDFFRAVSDNTRLVGIGTNDENNNRTMAVSLYDISNLENPTPLLARKEVALESSYSEGSWDDRAFSVIENAVSVQAENGTEETGLVLLPFQGWNEQDRSYVTAVQLFTFSDSSLTQRGIMTHDSAVRRSFLAQPDLAANLSDESLSLYTTEDPGTPELQGSLALAPNFRDVFAFGGHLARVHGGHYGYDYPSSANQPVTVDVISVDAELDKAPPLANIEVPAGTVLKQVGNLLVSVHMTDTTNWEAKDPERTTETIIEVFDFADPQDPTSVGTLMTDQLSPGGARGYYGPEIQWEVADCFDCGGSYYYGDYDDGIYALEQAIIFAEPSAQKKSLGIWEECYTYAEDGGRSCWASSDGESGCDPEWIDGSISCSTPEGGEETCFGEIQQCTEEGCEPIDSSVAVRKSCHTDERHRYWNSYRFEVLDLSDPSKPTLGEPIESPSAHEGTSIIAVDDTLYFNYQTAIDPQDGKPLIKRFVRMIDVGAPAKPVVSEGINIPGETIAVDGDSLFTRDRIWGDDYAETMVAKVTVDDGVATLEADYLFEGREVSSVELDGAGHVLITHGHRYSHDYDRPDGEDADTSTKLTLLDADALTKVGEVTVDSWGTFLTAKAGRAVFSVPSGILIMNTEDAKKPHAQAYFPTQSSGQMLVAGDDLIFAAGPYGIYRFDLNETNLSSK